MFQINDLVVYGKNGVCSVKGIGTLSLINNDRIYYTLVPVYNKEEIIYAPVENGRIVMREVISREDAKELIDIFPDLEETVVANERDRENCPRKYTRPDYFLSERMDIRDKQDRQPNRLRPRIPILPAFQPHIQEDRGVYPE